MGCRARQMAQPNFWDLAESNGVPHAQVGEGRVDPPKKGLWAIAQAFFGEVNPTLADLGVWHTVGLG